ncbi:MAG: hypothetical protein DHS20C14_18260 [Phycisphaeraceae bacterium]|nr:MAG: hypothetical protein DHS20C14_18260 [Phycisphaeraceae bacterium]
MSRRTTAALGAIAFAATITHAHPYGWRIGQDSSGEITVDFLWAQTHKAWTTDPGFDGIIDQNLNFEEWPVPNPAIDLNPIETGSKIVIEITSFDTGVFLWDPDDVGAAPLSSAGEQYSIGTGGTSFLRGAIWNIDHTTPGFDANKGIWEASFVFKDLSGQMADSQEYTFLLESAAVPAPGAAGTLALVGLAATRRRRRRR